MHHTVSGPSSAVSIREAAAKAGPKGGDGQLAGGHWRHAEKGCTLVEGPGCLPHQWNLRFLHVIVERKRSAERKKKIHRALLSNPNQAGDHMMPVGRSGWPAGVMGISHRAEGDNKSVRVTTKVVVTATRLIYWPYPAHILLSRIFINKYLG